MQVVLNGRSANLDPKRVSDLYIDQDGKTIIYSFISDPNELITLYEAKTAEQALVIYNKIIDGWKGSWEYCFLQEQTK